MLRVRLRLTCSGAPPQVREKLLVRVVNLCNLYRHSKRVDLGPDRLKWAAPETILSPREAQHTEATDVYSFGVLLWALASDKEPFENVDPASLADLVLTEQYRLPVPRGTPPAMAKLMDACWRPEADGRPTFATLATELQQLHRSLLAE